MALIDTIQDFIKSPRSKLAIEEARKLYSEAGGIIKTDGDRLIFPGEERIVSQMSEALVRKNDLTMQIRFWQRHHRTLASDNVLDDAIRVTDPLFWEHLMKLAMEKDYRQSFEKVDLPMKYMRDEKYRRIIKAFVRDKDYRKKLVKAKTGFLSKTSDSIKESADKKRDFKRKIVGEKLDRLLEEREKVSKRIMVLEAMLEWQLGKVEEERPAGDQE
jgi:hypothetical protein